VTTSEFVAAVILRATGKTSTAVSGDTKWTKVLGIGNLKIQDWADEPGVDWNSLYDPLFSIGTVTATDTFALDDSIRKISDTKDDYVVVNHTDGTGQTQYQVVAADDLKNYYWGQNKESYTGYYCAQIGRNLVFNHKFVTTDPQYGGTILVPVYTYPEPLVGDSDDVPVDIPNWLVVVAAAEYVRNDITKQNQFPGLIAEANEIMQRMKDDNDAQVQEVHGDWSPLGMTWS
jgi:hypothetical protein